MTKSEWIKLLVMLIVLYVALAPVFAMGLYNHLIFLPYREQQDLTPYFPKVESLTNSKMSYLTIPSGHAKLNAWYFKKTGANKITIVNHGNGGEIAQRLILCVPILSANSSVLLYDYEGFGKSTGEPSIPAVRRDGLAVYDYVRNVLHYAPEDIVVYGESLGSAVSTYIAQNRKVSGIIIQSGFDSLSSVAKDQVLLLNLYPDSVLSNLEMDNTAYFRGKHPPLLFVHGDADTDVQIKHAYKSFEIASEPKKFVKCEGAGHHDIYTHKLMTPTLVEFMKSLPGP